MKQRRWILAIVIAVGLYFLLTRRHEPIEPNPRDMVGAVSEVGHPQQEPPKPVPTAVADTKVISPTVAEVKAAQPAISMSAAGASARPQQPPGDFVEFRVVEGGHAVGFGDVILGKVPEGLTITKGVTEVKPQRLWNSPEIPFSVAQGVANRQPIDEAIAYFAANTSVRFVPRTNQADSVVFVPSTDLCASYLGRSGGPQPIFVSPKCGANEIMHEIMHVLGFVHEHARVDRDKYVEILWDNIDPQYWVQYYMVPDSLIHEYVGSVFSFDHESIMLYEPNFFAKTPGLVTMRSKSNDEIKPSRGHLSRTDLDRVYYLYGR